ncbi:DUF3817 domain-containing protein [Pseudoclavibacter helvolus]|uniref:Integral membrane protein n=1 Tax=Pseudoclavibacter helvolus TaxID=255205 RepID=A0A7W4UQL1_9MICO|nr:DUF3817 domain-containing protein [Pseudoclavibacter helvolus]MBB2958718.1 integral membrane protein [Pseudoclavibacter helvolus]
MLHDALLNANPGFRRALRFYQVTAYVTGILLLLLCVEMFLKYVFHLEVEAFGPFGFIALVQEGTTTALNLSLWVLIVHGWFYVVYLIASYVLWQQMRWPIVWLIAMAAGGIVPFLSFITEWFMSRRAKRDLVLREEQRLAADGEELKLREFEASLSESEREQLESDVQQSLAEHERRSK